MTRDCLPTRLAFTAVVEDEGSVPLARVAGAGGAAGGGAGGGSGVGAGDFGAELKHIGGFQDVVCCFVA